MKRIGTLMISLFFVVLLTGATCGPVTNSVVTPPLSTEGRDLYQQAERFYQAGDYDTALATYQQLQKQYPTAPLSAEAELRIGQCYFYLGDNAQSVLHLKTFAAADHSAADHAAALELIVRVQDAELIQLRAERETMLSGYQQKMARLEIMNQSLRGTVDSEVIYLEMDLEHSRLYVKMGAQVLYEYPIVSGKGETKLRLTGATTQFDTPRGIRRIERVEKDPIWYRPDWYWTEKGLPVPPNLTSEERGVPGTLGPYKLSFGEGYFIHGTRTGSINPGKFSHGCVRMNNKDLLKLVTLVEVGTLLYIY